MIYSQTERLYGVADRLLFRLELAKTTAESVKKMFDDFKKEVGPHLGAYSIADLDEKIMLSNAINMLKVSYMNSIHLVTTCHSLFSAFEDVLHGSDNF